VPIMTRAIERSYVLSPLQQAAGQTEVPPSRIGNGSIPGDWAE
jgi:hypothetical protein